MNYYAKIYKVISLSIFHDFYGKYVYHLLSDEFLLDILHNKNIHIHIYLFYHFYNHLYKYHYYVLFFFFISQLSEPSLRKHFKVDNSEIILLLLILLFMQATKLSETL